jgi:uncharacterized membrane protein
MFGKYAMVFGLGILELWAAIPVGLAFKLTPFAAGGLAALGSIFSVVIVLAVGKPLRNWLLRLRKNKVENTESKIQLTWNKYGVAGLGLLSPLLVGAHIGAAFAVAAGASPQKIMLWFSIGVVFWSVVGTCVFSAGLSLYQK